MPYNAEAGQPAIVQCFVEGSALASASSGFSFATPPFFAAFLLLLGISQSFLLVLALRSSGRTALIC